MTQKQKQSRERHIRRDFAHLMAQQIAALQSFQGLPKSAANLAKLDTASRKAAAAWTICISTNLDNPADFLRMVVESLEGKLHGARYDDAIEEAYWKACKTGKRKAERSNPNRPLFSEVADALILVLTEMGYNKDGPTEDGLRSRLKILGFRLSKKQGQHRKICHGPESLRNRGKRLH
jgi:hypothetical protein